MDSSRVSAPEVMAAIKWPVVCADERAECTQQLETAAAERERPQRAQLTERVSPRTLTRKLGWHRFHHLICIHEFSVLGRRRLIKTVICCHFSLICFFPLLQSPERCTSTLRFLIWIIKTGRTHTHTLNVAGRRFHLGRVFFLSKKEWTFAGRRGAKFNYWACALGNDDICKNRCTQ